MEEGILFRCWRILAPVLACALLCACQALPPWRSPAGAPWDRLVDDYLASTLEAQPELAAWAGRHEADGRLPDWSEDGLQREARRLHALRERALAIAPERLDGPRRFEREQMLVQIDRELFALETLDAAHRQPDYYAFGLSPDVYVARAYAPLPQRLAAFTAYAQALPAAAAQIRANLRPPLPRTFIQRGRIGFGGLADFLERDAPAVFAPVDDPVLQARLKASLPPAVQALRALDAWLATLEPSATDDFALGPERFATMLWATERIDVPLPALRAAAQRDLARNRAALHEACERVLPGRPLADCVARVRADKPDSPIEAARHQLDALRRFVQEQALVSIPGDEQALVAETPPYDRWNGAQITIPGPYERGLPSVYQIAPPDPAWTAEEREAYVPAHAELLFVSVHEVWPGHFLQALHARRSDSRLSPLVFGYAFDEGWAHYAEEMMWEAGLGGGDPALHVGQLLEALLRNVRLVCAIELHTGGMTVEQAEQAFREQAFQDAASARQQAARGTFDPGYGYYTLGKLMIRRLRDDWTSSRGGRAAWGAFHDRLLSYGSPPLPLLRREMLGPDSGPPF